MFNPGLGFEESCQKWTFLQHSVLIVLICPYMPCRDFKLPVWGTSWDKHLKQTPATCSCDVLYALQCPAATHACNLQASYLNTIEKNTPAICGAIEKGQGTLKLCSLQCEERDGYKTHE